MRISELAQLTGVSTDRLRRYEAEGLITSQRLTNGYRAYTPSVVREVIFIAMAREVGFSISQIAQSIPAFRTGQLSIDEMVNAFEQRIREVDLVIAQQQVLRQKLVDHIRWFRQPERQHPPKAP